MPYLSPETSLHVAFRDAPDNIPVKRRRKPHTAKPVSPAQQMAVDAFATAVCLATGLVVGQLPDDPIAPWVGSLILLTGLIFAVSFLSTYLRKGAHYASRGTPRK